MKQIFVLSKQEFDALMIKHNITNENVDSQDKACFISICDPSDNGHERYAPYFKEGLKNVKVLYFHDITEDFVDSMIQPKLFSDDDAKEIVKFADEHKDKENFFVHCAAGVSRSGATGTFLCEYFGLDYKDFKDKNYRIHPNPHILRTLRRISGLCPYESNDVEE